MSRLISHPALTAPALSQLTGLTPQSAVRTLGQLADADLSCIVFGVWFVFVLVGCFGDTSGVFMMGYAYQTS